MKYDYKQFKRKVIPILLKNGWIEIDSKKHKKLKCLKTNKTIMFSCTPSDGNAHRSTFRNIRLNDKVSAELIQKMGLY